MQDKLRMPFHPDEIEWRIGQSGVGEKGPWARILAYVTARAVMDRLDDVFGVDGWKDEYHPGPQGGVVCRLSCKFGDTWITKEDGAENTDIEAVKGGLSDALKRAAVKFGIGRYLYQLGESWAVFDGRGIYKSKIDGKFFSWNPPVLPDWARPPATAGETSPPVATPAAPAVDECCYKSFRSWVESKIDTRPEREREVIIHEWPEHLSSAMAWLIKTGKFKDRSDLVNCKSRTRFDEAKRAIEEEIESIVDRVTVFS